LAVVLLNATIGFVQEYKAEESMRALKKMVVPKAKVRRDGREKEIASENLVPGDIILLSSGSKVPADLRLIMAVELKADEATLTGESIAVGKITSPIEEENLPSVDQKNLAFMGTIIVTGRGIGVVVETGHKTVLGRIAEKVREVQVVKTPLQVKLDRFAKRIGLFVVGFSIFVFLIGIYQGLTLSEMFITAVATAVSAIPEGLPVAVTIALAIGVNRMARRKAIIRKLPAVETLGSTTVICSDKTGTLTKNEMTVRLIYDGAHTFEVTGTGYEPKGEIVHERIPIKAKELEHVQKVLRIGLLCNESTIYEEEGQHKVDGDPTEGALIVSAMKGGLSPDKEKEEYPELAIIPFESERGYMATLHKHRKKKIIFVKGSPENLLGMCTSCLDGKRPNKEEILKGADIFAKEGLRIIALGYKEVSPKLELLDASDVERGVIFAGIQGMMDPPRPEAIKAVQDCRDAGIRTLMLTGDHATTALAIARKFGIGGEDPIMVTGVELKDMSDKALFAKVKVASVYARISPLQKFRIVEQLIKRNEVVAVTGDGVNDAPALKVAHIGIAMGRGGTDVAKESSDMVLVDDNFATIRAAIEEGRVVYDNIKKVVLFLVSTGFAELIAILTTILLGFPIPFSPAQILYLNLVTNGFQDVALAFEPAEKGVLKRPPRNPKESILSRLMVERVVLMGIVMAVGTLYTFISALNSGASLERARTLALTTMVFFQFFQAFNSRSEKQSIFAMNLLSNPFLFFSIVGAFFAQLTILYVPAFQFIFKTEPLTSIEWVKIALVSVSILIVVEIDKWRRKGKRD
jgi:Ca2+-transporting ATPase